MNQLYTKRKYRAFLKERLSSHEEWMTRGLLKIYDSQTALEKKEQCTIHDNGVGFTGADGEFLSSLAVQWRKTRSFSPKQWKFVAKLMPRYWRQILELSDKPKLDNIMLKAGIQPGRAKPKRKSNPQQQELLNG